MLVLPGGRLNAFEIHEELAEAARRNLVPFENASVIAGNAALLVLPPSDLIYVNAGVIAPPKQWLVALRPGGRMIFHVLPKDLPNATACAEIPTKPQRSQIPKRTNHPTGGKLKRRRSH
jgi:protein-L-isoaspartate O-methyltransferase